MFETYRMLGRGHELELERMAGVPSRGAMSRRARARTRPTSAGRALAGVLQLALTKLAALTR